jgi:hypothetical protein
MRTRKIITDFLARRQFEAAERRASGMLFRYAVTCLVLVLCIVMLTAPAIAGDRKGLTGGAGLGLGITSYALSRDYSRTVYSAMSISLFVGYGITNQHMVTYFAESLSELGHNSQEGMIANFAGVVYSYYLRPIPQSLYISAGIGLTSRVVSSGMLFSWESHTVSGPAVYAGAGYMFVKHIQVTGAASIGKISGQTTKYLSVTVSVVAF